MLLTLLDARGSETCQGFKNMEEVVRAALKGRFRQARRDEARGARFC